MASLGTATTPLNGDSHVNGGQTTFTFNLIALLRAQRAFVGLTLIRKGKIDRPYPRLATVPGSALNSAIRPTICSPATTSYCE